MGKGDRNRTSDREAYRKNYTELFARCSRHPGYVPDKRKPRCEVCTRLWREAREK
jgi:hypothetical protein